MPLIAHISFNYKMKTHFRYMLPLLLLEGFQRDLKITYT